MEDQQQSSSLFSLNLDAQNSYTLRGAASWAKVLGVVGIILGILFIILGIAVQQAMTSSYGYRSRDTTTIGNLGMVFYMIIGLIVIISSIFALNAGNKITNALRANDQASLSSGFSFIRNYFAIWAIVIIILNLLFLIGIMSRI